MRNTATAYEIFIIDKLGGVTEQISVYVEFRDNGAIRGPSGTRVRNPVVSRAFRDGWQLCNYKYGKAHFLGNCSE